MTTDKIEKNCLVSPREMIVSIRLSAQGRDSNPGKIPDQTQSSNELYIMWMLDAVKFCRHYHHWL